MFDSLRVIGKAIFASGPVLLWVTLLLFLVETMFGLILHSSLVTYMKDPDKTDLQRETAFKYFGTYSRTMVTMTELTLGNFIPVLRFLFDNVNEYYGFAVLAYKLTIGFGVMRVITGVFINETFRSVASDDELMVVQKKRAQQGHMKKMHNLLERADSSGDSCIQRR